MAAATLSAPPPAASSGEAAAQKKKRRASRCLEASPEAALAWLARPLSTRRRAALRRVVQRVGRSRGTDNVAGADEEVLKNQAVQFLRLSRGRRRVAGHALLDALLADERAAPRAAAAAAADARARADADTNACIDAASLIASGRAGDAAHILGAFNCAAAPLRAERSAERVRALAQTAAALRGRDAERADDGVRDRLSASLCYDHHTAAAGGEAQTLPKGAALGTAWTGHVSRRDALVAQLGARCGFFDFVVGMVAMRLAPDGELASLARSADALRSDALRS